MRSKAVVVTLLLTGLLLSALSPVLAASAPAPYLPGENPATLAQSRIQLLVAPGGAWTLLGTQPPGRDTPGWAYDAQADRFILFGGSTSGTASTNSTWSYDYTNRTWTNVTPVVGPSARGIASMVYDSRADRIVLFGGSPAFPASLGDTWLFDYTNRTWTNVTTSTHPPARGFAAMSYDPVADRTILFGGVGGPSANTLFADTWAYDYGTNAWTQLSPAGSPSGRFGASMVYDPVAHASLLFGGATISGMSVVISNDLYAYAYTTNTWTRLQPPMSPPGRASAALAYDLTAHRLILFGGASGVTASSYRNDTWAYSSASNEWANLTPVHSPSARADAVMDFDTRAGVCVLFGGSHAGTGVPLDDAWSYEYGPALPTAPLYLAALSGAAQVTLTWQAPVSDGGSTITNYTVYRGTTSGAETLLKAVGPVLTYTDTAVTIGQTYYYEVSATNGVGEGPRSIEASVMAVTIPSAPQSPFATAGNARVVLTWQPPASNGSTSITMYNVYRGTSPGGETFYAPTGTGLTYTDTAVTIGQTYYYEVTAVNRAGEGPKSNETRATPTAPDTTPPTIMITFPANNSVVAFTVVTVNGTASDDTSVQIVEVSTDGRTWAPAAGHSTWTTQVVLVAGTNTIYARATDSWGNQATTRITVTLQRPSTGGPSGVLSDLWILLVVIVVAAAAGLAILLMRRRRKPRLPRAIPPPMPSLPEMPPTVPPPSPPAPPPGPPGSP